MNAQRRSQRYTALVLGSGALAAYLTLQGLEALHGPAAPGAYLFALGVGLILSVSIAALNAWRFN